MDPSTAKLTPEIFRKMQQQVVERMGDIEIPPEAIHPLGIEGMNLPGEASVPPEIAKCIEDRWHCAALSIERRDALESLWYAIKELNADHTGYTPKMAEAVAKLRKLEAGQ